MYSTSNGLLVVQLNPNPISAIQTNISDGLALKVVGGRDEVDPLQAPLALVHVQRAVRQLLLGAHVAADPAQLPISKSQNSSLISLSNR